MKIKKYPLTTNILDLTKVELLLLKTVRIFVCQFATDTIKITKMWFSFIEKKSPFQPILLAQDYLSVYNINVTF